MDDIKRLYIELLVSAINQRAYFGRKISRTVFEHYLELDSKKEEITERLRNDYRFMTSKHYDDLQNIKEYQENFDKKKRGFKNSLLNINTSKTEKVNLTDSEKKRISPAYNFYCSTTGQKSNEPLVLNRLNDAILLKLEKMIKQIGFDSIELGIREEVDNQLQFSDEYIPLDEDTKPREDVDRVADACWELYNSNDEITREVLLRRVLSEYRIENYAQDSPKEAKRKTKNAVKQWVRDVKKHNSIEISN